MSISKKITVAALFVVLTMGLASAHNNGNGNGNGNGGFPGFPGFGPGFGFGFGGDDEGGRGPIWQILRLNGEAVTWFSWLPNRRFAIYAGGSQDPVNHLVLDRGTGLVWQRSPSSDLKTWGNANNRACGNLALGNVRGWRLPTLEELATLETPSNTTDLLPTNHPFQNVSAGPGSTLYWTATSFDETPQSRAYGILFEGGGENIFPDDKVNTHHVWCVRGGQGVAAQ